MLPPPPNVKLYPVLLIGSDDISPVSPVRQIFLLLFVYCELLERRFIVNYTDNMTFSYLFYYMVVILNCIHDVRRLLMNEMLKSAVQIIIHNKIISCSFLLINSRNLRLL